MPMITWDNDKMPLRLCVSLFLNVSLLLYIFSGHKICLNFDHLFVADSISNSRRLNHDHKFRSMHNKTNHGIRRNIFLDFGANDGRSFDFFLAQRNSPGSQDYTDTASQGGSMDTELFGMGSDGSWDIIAFEASSQYDEILLQKKDDYLQKGRVQSFTLYPGTAIGDRNGTIELYWDATDGAGAGASVMTGTGSQLAYNHSTTIPVVDILDVFSEHHISINDYVVVKIDIEGSEYAVLKQMFYRGLVNRIDILAIEWHFNNYFVLDSERIKYNKRKECLDWMLSNLTDLKLIPWSR